MLIPYVNYFYIIDYNPRILEDHPSGVGHNLLKSHQRKVRKVEQPINLHQERSDYWLNSEPKSHFYFLNGLKNGLNSRSEEGRY